MTTAENDDWGPLSELPGNPLMWVLILSEMLVFSAFFVLFAWQRAADPELFNRSQQLLDPISGGLNTMVLLTSGLFAALAVQASAVDKVQRCRQWLGLASAGFKVQQILMVYLNLRASSSGWQAGFICLLVATVVLVFLGYLAAPLT